MNPNKIYTDQELRSAIENGVDKLADLVQVTLGARGRNVALPRPYGSSVITKDGVSVAREVFLSNPLENMWAQTVKEVAKKTNEDAGDGTTTATVLARSIIKLGLQLVNEGSNPMELKKGIDIAVSKIVEQLDQQKISVSHNGKQISEIATISANGDLEIGNLIAKAFAKVGSEGVIDVQDSKTSKSYVEFTEGMEIESGYASPYLVNTTKQTAEYENPLIMVVNKKIQTAEQVMKILNIVNDQKQPVVFIAKEIIGDALAFLSVNVSKNRHPLLAVNAPSFGDDQRNFLEDICVMTGATMLSEDKGIDFDHVTIDMLGVCEKIVSNTKMTTLMKGKGKTSEIENRCDGIRKSIETERDEMKERMLKHRLAKLNGHVAILNISAASLAESKEKKDRIEDAINATRAAATEGIVAGGGVALFNASNNLNDTSLRKDVQAGIDLVKKAAKEPIKQILRNAGMDYKPNHLWARLFPEFYKSPMDDILQEVKQTGMGYDVREERFCDMIEQGIIDPKKVTRVAMENAASVAGLVLTTQGAMVPKQIKNK